MSDYVLRVKADDATDEVVGGRHNLEEIWEELTERETE